MNEIFFSKYNLKKLDDASREGLLLRYNGGYSSLFTWPEFGDPTLAECIGMMKNGSSHPLISKALYFAELDSTEIYWPDLSIKNHFHFNGNDLPGGYQIVKRKIDPFVVDWPKWDVSWRLDANNKFINADHFLQFYRRLPDRVRQNVVLVEDPCKFSPDEWSKIQSENINIAWDWQIAGPVENKQYYSTYVFKPARDDRQWVEKNFSDKSIMVTSYLDHPVGQLSALYEAQKLKESLGDKVLSCGLLTHSSYVETSFSKKLIVNDNQLLRPKDVHWGMKEELENLTWEKI